MKTLFNFLFKFMDSKTEYIGLSSFKDEENKISEIKKETAVQKSSLTGILKRV